MTAFNKKFFELIPKFLKFYKKLNRSTTQKNLNVDFDLYSKLLKKSLNKFEELSKNTDTTLQKNLENCIFEIIDCYPESYMQLFEIANSIKTIISYAKKTQNKIFAKKLSYKFSCNLPLNIATLRTVSWKYLNGGVVNASEMSS